MEAEHEVLNVAQRRQAIQRGLKHYFQGTALEQVVGYWEQEYSEKPAFVLNRFLSDICTTDELKQSRKDMLKDVLYELTNIEKTEILQLETEVEVQDTHTLKTAYQDFVEAILHSVPSSDREDFFLELRRHVIAKNLLVGERAERIYQSEKLMACIETHSVAQAVTALYTVYCDFYGPQKTDRLYAAHKNEIKFKYPDLDLHQLL
ncbi:hypothetical protein A3K93_10035 [Acinetobacter sp. NCu2D-2]|uniref:hypothetical protein n=1 Tax=Acinetobacter sp. NCu2D-2 TaxID=1608473 RepID=UPI0007CDC364|nr:hypothetical protein [Acinetobacter sp. NCu2D-2]ANF82495.1 hypothetical protein A3K93_10035 [Acinetobacter sp. NCu2D-2]